MTTAMKNKVNTYKHIRWMIRRDMPEVYSIEDASFDCPWLEEDFLFYLRKRNCIGMVCENRQGDILAFMVYELHTEHLKVLNFAVHPGYRRQGVGRAMLEKLKEKLSSHRRTSITLEVRETNLPAQLFFRRMRFLATEVRKGAYEDTQEDAYILEFALD